MLYEISKILRGGTKSDRDIHLCFNLRRQVEYSDSRIHLLVNLPAAETAGCQSQATGNLQQSYEELNPKKINEER